MNLNDINFDDTARDLKNAFAKLNQAMTKLTPEQRADFNAYQQKITKIGFSKELTFSEKFEKIKALENEMKQKYGAFNSK